MHEAIYRQSRPSHFYAVGIGPGSSDMITVRAKRIIETADVIVAPRSRIAKESMALEAIRPWLAGQQVEECVYSMKRDQEATSAFWKGVADRVFDWCQAGKSVAQVTIGDPLIYSSSCYLLAALDNRLPSQHIHVVSGISAFMAASALFKEALTMQEDRLMLMPATDLGRVEEALTRCETLVLYKAGRCIDQLCTLLEKKGLASSARLVCYVEDQFREYSTRTITEAVGSAHGYMVTVIVHLARCRWEDVERNDGINAEYWGNTAV